MNSTYSIINDSARVNVQYTVNENGVIKVDFALAPRFALPNIPKVGMQTGIERSFEQINWFGRGPMENYIDKRYGFDVKNYELSLPNFIENYAVPQENGNRTDVRWMSLSNPKQEGLLVVADSLLSMSAWANTEANIQQAKHTNKLVDAGYLTLNIDLIQMGVGGNDSWSDVAAPLEQYQIKSQPYRYIFYLLPYKKDKATLLTNYKKIAF